MPEEKLFAENLDRLLAGRDIQDVPPDDRDLQSALDFARLMYQNRPQPAPHFQSDLKARLFYKLAHPETQPKAGVWHWWVRRTMWRAVTTMVAVLVIAGVIFGLVMNQKSPDNIVMQPTPTPSVPVYTSTSAAATKTTAAMTTSAYTTTKTTPAASSTTVPGGLAGVNLIARAGTDKSGYKADEPVNINVVLKNNGSQPVFLSQFPPILSLMSAAGQPVLTFAAGQSGKILNPGDSASFLQVWNQVDAHGQIVPAGRYFLELEDLDLQGLTYKLNLEQPVSFDIIR